MFTEYLLYQVPNSQASQAHGVTQLQPLFALRRQLHFEARGLRGRPQLRDLWWNEAAPKVQRIFPQMSQVLRFFVLGPQMLFSKWNQVVFIQGLLMFKDIPCSFFVQVGCYWKFEGFLMCSRQVVRVALLRAAPQPIQCHLGHQLIHRPSHHWPLQTCPTHPRAYLARCRWADLSVWCSSLSAHRSFSRPRWRLESPNAWYEVNRSLKKSRKEWSCQER